MNESNFGSADSDVAKSIALAVAALGINLFTKIHPIWIIIAAGFGGWLIF